MPYDQTPHNRRSIRLKGYDYAQQGRYFITIVAQNRIHRFGRVVDEQMVLSPEGRIVLEEWHASARIRDNILLHECVVMPNHFHGIIEIVFSKGTNENSGKFTSPVQTIGSIIRGFKAASTTRIKKLHAEASTDDQKSLLPIPKDGKIWQRNYDDTIIWNESAYRRISNYIKNNPKNWTKDKLSRRR